MASTNMATTQTQTDSLEQSFQKCSPNVSARSFTFDEASQNQPQNEDIITIELNSHTSLPYYWEQRLDLKVCSFFIFFIKKKKKKPYPFS